MKYSVFHWTAGANVRYPAFPPTGFPGDSMNGAGTYAGYNQAAAAAVAMGVHSTTIEAHQPVSHSTAHSTPHSTLSDSGNHLIKSETSEVH